MSFTRRNLLLLAAAIGIAAGPATAYADDVLNVGAYPTNPPFEYKNESGTFEGFEVDIVNEAAKRIGMTTENRRTRLPGAVCRHQLRPHRCRDLLDHHHAERLKTQSFTQPYYDSDMGIATKTDSPIKAEADLKGKIVGVLSGSTGETWVKEHQEADGFSEVKGYNTQQNLLLDLSAGRVDAAVSDIPGMEYSFTKMKDLPSRSASRPANSTA